MPCVVQRELREGVDVAFDGVKELEPEAPLLVEAA
jgi:hypothetical protein